MFVAVALLNIYQIEKKSNDFSCKRPKKRYFIHMTDQKPPRKGPNNKGREHWVNTSLRVDPHLRKRAAEEGLNMTEVFNGALAELVGEEWVSDKADDHDGYIIMASSTGRDLTLLNGDDPKEVEKSVDMIRRQGWRVVGTIKDPQQWLDVFTREDAWVELLLRALAKTDRD